jgi:hypothetical protein
MKKPKGEISKIIMISVNDIFTQRTGGEYVYKVIKDELVKQRYNIYEISVPILLKKY